MKIERVDLDVSGIPLILSPAVSCIATLAKVPAKKAVEAALRNGCRPGRDEGLFYQVCQTLNELGVNAELKENGEMSTLPRCAVIALYGISNKLVYTICRKKDNGKTYIYDWILKDFVSIAEENDEKYQPNLKKYRLDLKKYLEILEKP